MKDNTNDNMTAVSSKAKDINKPELVYVNRKALRDFDIHLEYAVSHLQAIHDEYLRVIGTPPTIEEITSWFGYAKRDFLVQKIELIRESIIEKMETKHYAAVPWMQFNRELVILPDLEPLNEICGQLIFIPGIENKEIFFWNCYRIVKDKIELIPEAVEAVKNAWRVYASTPEEKARYAVMRKLCDQMNTIKLTNPSAMNVPGFVVWDNEAGVYVPMEHYVKGYIK